MHLYPVNLNDGTGSRLGPVSREFPPKPRLVRRLGEQTLIQGAASKLEALSRIGNPVFVCNEEHRFLVAGQVCAQDKQPEATLLEPQGRNTARGSTVVAAYLAYKEPEALMVAMPADHVSPDQESFAKAVEEGGQRARQGYLVIFGIVVDQPKTGYRYIHRSGNLGTIRLEIIDVQYGSYLGEDDIVQFEDVYNRVN